MLTNCVFVVFPTSNTNEGRTCCLTLGMAVCSWHPVTAALVMHCKAWLSSVSFLWGMAPMATLL